GNQPNLGFVLAATIPGPAGPAPDLLRAQAAPVSRRRPRPADRRQHFIVPWWPAGSCRLVPLRGARRKVTHRYLEPAGVGEAGQFLLPSPHPVAVRAPRVGGDQQPGRRRVAVPALTVPPAAQGRDRERGGVPIAAHRHPPGVGGQVVAAGGHRLLGALLGEVVGAHPYRLPRPMPLLPGRRVLAEHFLLLRVHADHRLPGRGELLDLAVDVPKLRVAVRVAGTLGGPRGALQGEPLGLGAARPPCPRPPGAPAGPARRPASGWTSPPSAPGPRGPRVPLPGELGGQLPGGLPRPGQR